MGEKKGIPIPQEKSSGSPKHPSSLGNSPRTHAGRHFPLARSTLTTDLEEEMGSRIRSSSFGGPLSKAALWLPKRVMEASGKVGSSSQLESYKNTHVGVLRNPKIPDDTRGFTTRRTVS